MFFFLSIGTNRIIFVCFIDTVNADTAPPKFVLPLTILTETPPWIITTVFMLLTVYGMYAGIEILTRIAGVLLPVLIVFILLEIILLGASGSLHVNYLMPVLGEGFGRVADTLWPLGIMQTYGQSIEMAVFWHLLNKQGYLGRISVGATLFAGLILVLFNLLAIMALGEHIFQEMMLPSYTILKLSSVSDFLENLEAFGALYFISTSFIKFSIHAITAALCIRELTFAAKDGIPIWITAISTYIIGMTMAGNFSEH